MGQVKSTWPSSFTGNTGSWRGTQPLVSPSIKITWWPDDHQTLHTMIHGVQGQMFRGRGGEIVSEADSNLAPRRQHCGEPAWNRSVWFALQQRNWKIYLNTSCWMKKESLAGLRTKFCMKDCGMSSSVCWSWQRININGSPPDRGTSITSHQVEVLNLNMNWTFKKFASSLSSEKGPTENLFQISSCPSSNSESPSPNFERVGEHCLLDRGRDIVNSESKYVVRNEPRGVRRFQDKRLGKPVGWVFIGLRKCRLEQI